MGDCFREGFSKALLVDLEGNADDVIGVGFPDPEDVDQSSRGLRGSSRSGDEIARGFRGISIRARETQHNLDVRVGRSWGIDSWWNR